MTETVSISKQVRVSKKELFEFLGWHRSAVEVGSIHTNIPLDHSFISAIVDIPCGSETEIIFSVQYDVSPN